MVKKGLKVGRSKNIWLVLIRDVNVYHKSSEDDLRYLPCLSLFHIREKVLPYVLNLKNNERKGRRGG